MIDFDTFTKMPWIVGDLGKLIVAKGFKKLPNLVTLIGDPITATRVGVG